MKHDISALGELLIDFTPYVNASDGAKLFGRKAGGAPIKNIPIGTCIGV